MTNCDIKGASIQHPTTLEIEISIWLGRKTKTHEGNYQRISVLFQSKYYNLHNYELNECNNELVCYSYSETWGNIFSFNGSMVPTGPNKALIF